MFSRNVKEKHFSNFNLFLRDGNFLVLELISEAGIIGSATLLRGFNPHFCGSKLRLVLIKFAILNETNAYFVSCITLLGIRIIYTEMVYLF